MLPVLFTIGPFNAYVFGFMLALSFLIATFVVYKKGQEELREEEYLDCFLFTSFISLVAGRVTYILFHLEEFGLNVLRYIVVRETPGLSLIGGLAGGFTFLFWYAKKKKYSVSHVFDIFSLAASCALIFAKIGEQLGGAGFGRLTNSIIGVTIVGQTGSRHPVELYEALAFFVLSVLLLILYKKGERNRWPQGFIFLLFVFASCIIIFLLEFFKEYPIYLYGLSFKQVVTIGVFVIVSILLAGRIRTIWRLKH